MEKYDYLLPAIIKIYNLCSLRSDAKELNLWRDKLLIDKNKEKRKLEILILVSVIQKRIINKYQNKYKNIKNKYKNYKNKINPSLNYSQIH
jgi:hypothetical protein